MFTLRSLFAFTPAKGAGKVTEHHSLGAVKWLGSSYRIIQKIKMSFPDMAFFFTTMMSTAGTSSSWPLLSTYLCPWAEQGLSKNRSGNRVHSPVLAFWIKRALAASFGDMPPSGVCLEIPHWIPSLGLSPMLRYRCSFEEWWEIHFC